jgi:hypothetical protein
VSVGIYNDCEPDHISRASTSNGTGQESRVLKPRKVPEQTGLKMEVLELRMGLRTVKHHNKSEQHLVLFCDFLGPVFIQRESTSTSNVLLLALRTPAR